MGFDAIWISPVAKQVSNASVAGQAYHGYWPTSASFKRRFGSPGVVEGGYELTLSLVFPLSDLLELSGTAADLKALSTALHARGMALMVDIIVNDVAFPLAKSTSTFDPTIGIYGPFDSWDDYHSACAISTSSQTSIENCASLCPLAHEQQEYRDS